MPWRRGGVGSEEVRAVAVRPEKVQAVEEITAKLRDARAAIITDYRGLNVAEMTELRKRLREAGVEFKVVKNTLTRRATAAVQVQDLDQHLTGPTAIAFGFDDVVVPAKILSEFAKDHKALEIKGGLIEGKAVDAAGVDALAKLPPREGLLSMLLSVMQAPMRNLAYAVKQIAEQKETGGAAASEA
ncbi:50S ribosomal protein L10 [Kyrpidia spormannii]|uniref:Large ribosomal subunit protein uL10 n=3 Tax=Kyrpidia TaxID=1129704 RepID=A0A2K8N5D9_9BACL|nr:MULTISPECIES: 50S ribosomal protein L10 [Kyrpidia]ADG04920.1 ribosomal protein L10 [Kyrpidia tusciae DSM 2912]ATY83682.1 50S ribosomal protein L10 [Kyrpidia spormannii]MCL6575358.1 50S ribosomal protein L10 [Kyrpidia sp.]CAB3389321.1 ribosomal protein L10 (BL5) [Kyrpidia spormannii]CAB3389909.1 ribosomal protein L10 (BL5) [Kyrpidia spormannii]